MGTLIETIHGEVKLIKRANDPYTNLETLIFHNREDCLKYVDLNRFQINIIHSGKKGRTKKSPFGMFQRS